jgi:hypothetical protein
MNLMTTTEATFYGIRTGAIVELRPGYNMMTRECDLWDEYAGCMATVLRICSCGELVLEIQGHKDDVHVNRSRVGRVLA